MKDLKKVQEFFSRNLEEVTNEYSPSSYAKLVANGDMKIEDAMKETGFDYVLLMKLVNKAKDDLANKVKGVAQNIREEQEDPTDIIAMDIPLFLRMLEYAREDAEQDIDLHKVTERAIEAVKLRGLLSMDDYQDIVGEPIDEEIDYLSLKDDNPFDDVPSIDIQMIDDKEGVSSPKAFVNFSSMYHSGDNGKMEILRNNPALQDKVMMALQAEFQKTFRRVIHGILGEPFGLDEMTGYSKYLATPENPKSKTPGLPPSIMDKILMEISTMRDNDREETIRLGEGLIEEELCAKGKAYRKRRIAAGEKSSAYLSGRAVKVCKGQMSGRKKK
jgi:hypothetical protein